jgi:hypothetical protein
MSSIITKGFGVQREAIILKGYGRRIEQIVDEVVDQFVRRRGGSKSRRRKLEREGCEEFTIDVCLKEANGEQFLEPIREHIVERLKKEPGFGVRVSRVTVEEGSTQEDITVKVRLLPKKSRK